MKNQLKLLSLMAVAIFVSTGCDSPVTTSNTTTTSQVTTSTSSTTSNTTSSSSKTSSSSSISVPPEFTQAELDEALAFLEEDGAGVCNYAQTYQAVATRNCSNGPVVQEINHVLYNTKNWSGDISILDGTSESIARGLMPATPSEQPVESTDWKLYLCTMAGHEDDPKCAKKVDDANIWVQRIAISNEGKVLAFSPVQSVSYDSIPEIYYSLENYSQKQGTTGNDIYVSVPLSERSSYPYEYFQFYIPEGGYVITEHKTKKDSQFDDWKVMTGDAVFSSVFFAKTVNLLDGFEVHNDTDIGISVNYAKTTLPGQFDHVRFSYVAELNGLGVPTGNKVLTVNYQHTPYISYKNIVAAHELSVTLLEGYSGTSKNALQLKLDDANSLRDDALNKILALNVLDVRSGELDDITLRTLIASAAVDAYRQKLIDFRVQLLDLKIA